MPKRYVFFTSLPYAYPIYRPLQEAIRAKGDEVAWYIEEGCPNLLTKDEVILETIDDVVQYNPLAIFGCGNTIYHFLPGIKVAVFHGYPILKRGETDVLRASHFRIRGWFDMYCTQGPSSTETFKLLESKHETFKVYETGWSKVDPYFKSEAHVSTKPTVLYATTFTKGITSAPVLVDTITKLVKEKPWNWRLTFHPKLDDQTVLDKYRKLADEHENVTFIDNVSTEDFQQADVMLCDSSSIILEFMFFNKPVVTYRNTKPGSHLLNTQNINEVENALEVAFTRPKELMKEVEAYSLFHEAHRDGRNCERILEAVDDFNINHRGRLKPKPLNLWRKFRLRNRLKYWK